MKIIGKVFRFNVLCLAASILYCYLFGLLLLSPESLFKDLGIPDSNTATFIARRAAMLMAGFALITFFGRNFTDNGARRAICVSVSASMTGLAITGFHALQTGFVSQRIIVPIVIELAFAILFLLAWFFGKHKYVT
jgi:hypothetical protein